jgi:hypothetical protein
MYLIKATEVDAMVLNNKVLKIVSVVVVVNDFVSNFSRCRIVKVILENEDVLKSM